MGTIARILNLSQKPCLSIFGLPRYMKCNFHTRNNALLGAAKHGANLSQSEVHKFQKGQVIHGFVVDEIAKVDEVHLTVVRLSHLSTGAQYLHIARDDSNNVFSVGFRTTPKDSTGLPHILEHITLCGSERYPCRDRSIDKIWTNNMSVDYANPYVHNPSMLMVKLSETMWILRRPEMCIF